MADTDNIVMGEQGEDGELLPDLSRQEMFEEMKESVANRVEDNNQNLADMIRDMDIEQAENSSYMDALKDTYPEHRKQLKSIEAGIDIEDKAAGRKPDPDQYFDDGTFLPNSLAMEIEEDYDFVWNLFEEKLYVYTDGVYRDNGERVIKEECNRRLANKFRKNRVTQVVEAIKTRPGVSKEKEEFRPPRYKINFENGVYDLQKGELVDHSPEYYFTQQIPWSIPVEQGHPDNENGDVMDCPEIKKFLEEITGSKEDMETLIELTGYAMMTSMPIEHAFILVGKGSNGKTMFLELLKKVLGKKNVKDENLQQLESNRFSTSWLYRKLAVISDDLPDKPVQKGGVIKGLTGGSDVRAEGKHGDGFEFENYALPIFAANHIPPAEDQSDGFFRRWTIIDFPYQFKPEGQYDETNPMHKKAEPEMKLKNRVMDKSEIRGLVYQAVNQLEDVIQQGQFTHQQTPAEVRSMWNSYAEPVQEFINDYIEQGINQDAARQNTSLDNTGQHKLPSGADFLVKQDVHQLIKAFCDSRSTIPPTLQKLTRTLKDNELYFDPTARTTQVPDENGQTRVYRGLEWSEEWEKLVESSEDVADFKQRLGITDTTVELPERVKDMVESSSPDNDNDEDNNGDGSQPSTVSGLVQDVMEKDEELSYDELKQRLQDELGGELDETSFETHVEQLLDDGTLYEPRSGTLSRM